MKTNVFSLVLQRLKELDAAKKEYLRTRGNEGRGALEGIETADEVYKLTGDVNIATELKDAKEPGGRIERMETLDKRYIDSQNLQSMMLGHQMQQSNNQFALQQSQLQLQNRREDAREARSERKDRQMMIMQMMKGLSQMGASMAI